MQRVVNALRGLSGPGLSGEDDELRVAVEHGEELAHLLVNGQLFADFEDVVVLFRVWPQVERVDVARLLRNGSVRKQSWRMDLARCTPCCTQAA